MNGVNNYPNIKTEIVVDLGADDEPAENLSLTVVDFIK